MSSQLARTVRPLFPLIEGEQDIAREGEQVADEATQRDAEVQEEVEESAAINPKVARKPATPTKAMILAHEVHHADYRE